jgi:tetratricopeptide (TPR) repeat protein
LRLGQLLVQRGDAAGAVAEFDQSVSYWTPLVKLAPDDPQPFQSRAEAKINLATAHRLLGHYQREAAAYRDVIADYAALSSAMPMVPVYRENVALTEIDLGQLLYEMGKPKEAVDLLVNTRVRLQELMNNYPDLIRCREELAVALDNLGQAQSDIGLFDEALASHKAAESLLKKLVEDVPDQPAYRERHAVCSSHLGKLQVAVGDDDGINNVKTAVTELEEVRDAHQDLITPQSALAIVQGSLAEIESAANRADEAQKWYQAAAKTWAEVIKASPSAEYYHRAASFFSICGPDSSLDPNTGLKYAQQAAAAAPENGHYLGTLAAAELRAGKVREALEHLQQASKAESHDEGRDLIIYALCQQRFGDEERSKQALLEATTWVAKNRPGNLPLKKLLAEAERGLQKPSNASVPSAPK